MCGIAGIFDHGGKAVDRELLEDMTSTLQHRGPDGDGCFAAGRMGIGHRRLSIIDVEGGGQPLANEDGTLQVVFNGEIYNYLELRQELLTFGHRFATASDTEVIVHAYEQWGEECVSRFNGMFAFAIANRNDDSLFLARDHLGIKPLYYATLGNQLVFASEIRALLKHPSCPREVDVESLVDLFTFRYVPSPKTMFRGIRKLPPGHSMSVDARGTRFRRYWKWTPHVRTRWDEPELIEEYQSLLEDAVRLQLRSDVPLGLFLSSGIDSGILLAIMSQYSSGRVRAFTMGFEGGEDTNEVDDARALAKHFGADHQYAVVGPGDYLAYYDRYLRDLEEPVGHEAASAFYFLSRNTSAHVKVALTGQGADEPWAGYDRYVGVRLSTIYSRLPSFVKRCVASSITNLPGRFERAKRGAVSLGERDVLTRFAGIYSFFSPDMKAKLYGERVSGVVNAGYSSQEAIRRLQSDVAGLDPLAQILYIDTRASLPDDLLMVGDKMSMANSLEVRVPFLDHRVIEFVESLPSSLKLNRLTGKYLHKKAAEKWLPKNVVYRRKKGFANPLETWFREGLRPFVDECLLAKDSAVGEYFNREFVATMLARDRQGADQFRRHIHLLMSFELWHRTFIRSSPGRSIH